MQCAALIIYEFLITLDTEVRLFWGREITGASVVFFVNRYMMLVYAVFSMWEYSPLATSASVRQNTFQLYNSHPSNPQVYVESS